MKITSIKQQIKQSNRYSVYIDEAYSFSLSESALIQSGIASGREVTRTDIDSYKKLSLDDKLYNRALRYVAMRQRTTWDVQTYLRRKEASDQFIEQTVAKFTDLGLINDSAYAESFVRDRQLLRPTSRRKLLLELKQKRISEHDIAAAIEANEFSETDSLKELIAKKRRQSKYQDDTKLMQYLARQGYGYGDIKSALNADVDY